MGAYVGFSVERGSTAQRGHGIGEIPGAPPARGTKVLGRISRALVPERSAADWRLSRRTMGVREGAVRGEPGLGLWTHWSYEAPSAPTRKRMGV